MLHHLLKQQTYAAHNDSDDAIPSTGLIPGASAIGFPQDPRRIECPHHYLQHVSQVPPRVRKAAGGAVRFNGCSFLSVKSTRIIPFVILVPSLQHTYHD